MIGELLPYLEYDLEGIRWREYSGNIENKGIKQESTAQHTLIIYIFYAPFIYLFR